MRFPALQWGLFGTTAAALAGQINDARIAGTLFDFAINAMMPSAATKTRSSAAAQVAPDAKASAGPAFSAACSTPSVRITASGRLKA